MIEFQKKTLANGLTVIVHEDPSTPMVAVNVLYKVGARNEDYDHTGFAHLFEHLMFGGSVNIPSYDEPVQLAGGENNAFTNNDYTNYYLALPRENIETALWLESDRMLSLAFNERSLEVQRKVVIEEFAQRYLNQPYGDIWLLLRPLAYERHPYRWATIGRDIDHIRNATMEQVRAFFSRYYKPSNAILSIAGDIPARRVFDLVEKWFGPLPGGTPPRDKIPAEPVQTAPRRLEVRRPVPASVIYIAFHTGPRMSREVTVCDVISDLLSNGTSSRLYQRLVKENPLFSNVNAYISGDVDPGLFLVTGHVMEGTSLETAEAALWNELERMKNEPVGDYELEKVKNKFEANNVFGEINVLNKAMNLAYFEMLGDAALINDEVAQHNSVTRDEIQEVSRRIFRPENSSTLLYIADPEAPDTAPTE
ncbi:M16 family metallopeptidase [Millionella massiliensis]|uniref:M16 family metallopeptidase n=1 Tax=Millionella massiliensis TaxID=1871023 RepID=UPI0008DA25C3|nr:pitrilysin family protein [Millionella massiliensis]